MIKNPLKSLEKSKWYKQANIIMRDTDIKRFEKFHGITGFTYDRARFCVQCILLDYNDWSKIWESLKSMKSCTLEYMQLYHGEEVGLEKYKKTNKAKTKHFDHSSEIQREKARKAVQAKRKKRRLLSQYYSILDETS